MAFNITFHDFTHGQLDKTLKSRSDLDIYNKGALELKNLVVRPGGAAKSRFGTEFLFESGEDVEKLLEPETLGYQMFAFTPSENLKLLIILGAAPAGGHSRYQCYVERNDSFWGGLDLATGKIFTITSTSDNYFEIDTKQVERVKYRTAQNQTDLVLVTGTTQPIVITAIEGAILPATALQTRNLNFRRYPQHDFTNSGYIFQQPIAPVTPQVAYAWQISLWASVAADPIPVSRPNATADFPLVGPNSLPLLHLTNPLPAPPPPVDPTVFNGFNYVFATLDQHYVGGLVQMAGPVDDPTAPIGTAVIVKVHTNEWASIRVLTPIDKGWRAPLTVNGDQMVLTEPAFSSPTGTAPDIFPGRGWPRTVSFYESRLIFAGTSPLPQSLFMSQTGAFNNFDTGTGEPADGIAYTIASGAEDQIINMISGRSLQVFTTTNEFSAPVWSEQGLTPTTVTIRRQTSIGSSNCIPAILDNMTMYSKRGGKAVMAFESLNSGGNTYNSQDASVHSSEIINNPVHMTSYVENIAYDANLLFVINKTDEENEGNLILFESLREQSVQAWTTLDTDGEFTNVEAVGDDVFFMVKRQDIVPAPPVTKWSLERMNWLACLDGAVSHTAATPGVPGTAISLPTFMWNKTVDIVGWTGTDPQKVQGVWLGEFLVHSDGQFLPDIPAWYPAGGNFQYWIGLKFEQLLQTMPVDIKTQMGSMLFLKKKIYKCYVEYIDSYPFFVNGIEADLRSLAFSTGQYEPGYIPGVQLNTAEEPFAGIWMRPTMQKLNLPPTSGTAFRGFVREATVLITNNRPLPMIIQGITAATS